MITSLHNEQVKHVVSLQQARGRKEAGEFLIEGKRFVREAFLRKATIKRIYCTTESKESTSFEDILALARQQGIEAEEVAEAVMQKMTATEEPQGILAIAEKAEFSWQDIVINDKTILLIIDGIQDPGNAGTILRTALAADVKQIVLTKGTVDVYNPKVLRSSMGAIFSQVILVDRTTEEIVNFCSAKRCTLAVSTMEGNSIFQEKLSEYYPYALVIGNEAFGPNRIFMDKALMKYSIPMFNNVESLNAAMAAGIFLYEMRRQVEFL